MMCLARKFAGLSHFRQFTNRMASTRVSHSFDTFGDLTDVGEKRLAVDVTERLTPEDPDNYDKIEFDIEARKNAYYYKYEIKNNVRKGAQGIRRALELFAEMKTQARLTPDAMNFPVLILGCARVGYTKKAFELYTEYLRYRNKPTASIVTCLINACAESPFPDYGLSRLNWFLNHLKTSQNFRMNLIQYNSAVKAYGKLGKLDEASKIIQEMIENNIKPDKKTFSMLLMGCASDKISGTALALRVFKRMKLYGLQPETDTYRIMLRCIRDCGVGSAELLQDTLKELPTMTSPQSQLIYKKFSDRRNKRRDINRDFVWLPLLDGLGGSIQKAIVSHETESSLVARKNLESSTSSPQNIMTLPSISDKSLVPVYSSEHSLALPNLLSDNHLELMSRIEALDFSKLNDAKGRLKLFGGLLGYLETMKSDGCQPDVKTFNLILDCIEQREYSQKEYFRLSQDYNIKRDLIFYDCFFKNICKSYNNRNRLELAKSFIDQMHLDGLRPNISTYESLASGCNSLQDAKQLITDLEESGLVVSDAILTNFFYVSLHRADFDYLIGMIDESSARGYRPSAKLVEHIEAKRLAVRKLLVEHEKGLCDLPRQYACCDSQLMAKFERKYKSWLKSVQIREDEHPWEQYDIGKYGNHQARSVLKKLRTLLEEKEKLLPKLPA